MIRMTIQHYEVPFSARSGSKMKPPTFTTDYTTDQEPADYSPIGEMVAPWITVGPNAKQAQFSKRQSHKRIDNLFVVTITETIGGDA